MLLNYGPEIEHITREFDKKINKKLKIDSLINLNNKLSELENTEIEKSILELKSILGKIADNEPKQYRIYRKQFESLKKNVIEEFGFHQKGSIIEKYIGLGLVFGIAIGAALTSMVTSSAAIGLVLGMTIGSAIGSKKEKAEEEAGNIY